MLFKLKAIAMSNGPQEMVGTNEQVALESVTPFWHGPWRFAVHALVGTSIFLIIAAVGLEFVVRKLDTFGVGIIIIFGLRTGEYALFGVDLVLFGVFLWRTAARTAKNL